MFFLLYKRADNDVFDDFRPLSEDFRNFPKLSHRQDERSRTFPRISENFRSCPKIAEDFRGRPEDVSKIHQRI